MQVTLNNIIPTSINQFTFATIIAETEGMPLDVWRKIRKDFLGGSDAAPVLGLSRYKSQIGVYFDKTHHDDIDQEDSQKMKAGRMMEPMIAFMFAEKTGKHVVRQPFFYAHPVHTFMGANVDFGIYGENAGLECKNSAYRKDWEDGVPDEYYMQCNHYMAVTGADRWYLAYLIDGWDFQYTVIERNETLINTMIEKETEFWNTHILPKQPPMFDGSDSATAILKVMFPSETLEQHDPAEIPNEFDALWEEVEDINKQEKVLETRKKEIKNQICAIIGERNSGMSKGYIFTWGSQTRKSYTVAETSYRVLRAKVRKA